MPPRRCASPSRLLAALFVLTVSGTTLAGQFENAMLAYAHGDYFTALRLLRPLADAGDADAEYNLAWMYETATGEPQDYTEAMKWYRAAAEQGHAGAQYSLGVMYATGEGIAPDYAEAAKWFHRSADQGNPRAQGNLGSMYAAGLGLRHDDIQAYLWLSLAAARFKPAESTELAKAIAERDHTAARMTPAQIAEARRLVEAWQPTR